MLTGKAIRLFLVDGTPAGILTAEITNWTGHILASPRSRIQEALTRPEAKKTGIYFLVGDEEGRPVIYVGEGDCIADRVKAHAKDTDKEFWERVFLVTSKDFNLTKAHVRYLESRLVQTIKMAGRAACVNGNDPAQSVLPEADISDMEFFLVQLGILLPAVGLDVLRLPEIVSYPPPSGADGKTDRREETKELTKNPSIAISLIHKTIGVEALGFETDGEIVVLKGSIGTGKEYKSNSYAALRKQLIKEGRVELLSSGQIRFRTDVVFKSPSAAAAVLNNCNSNGRTEWKLTSNGMTLGAWWNAQLERLDSQ